MISHGIVSRVIQHQILLCSIRSVSIQPEEKLHLLVTYLGHLHVLSCFVGCGKHPDLSNDVMRCCISGKFPQVLRIAALLKKIDSIRHSFANASSVILCFACMAALSCVFLCDIAQQEVVIPTIAGYALNFEQSTQ